MKHERRRPVACTGADLVLDVTGYFESARMGV
jgi:hypothetical protein